MPRRSEATRRAPVVGFVCEGSTDILVLRRVVEQVLDREIDARALQPATDALDRQIVGTLSGWSEVRAWCQRMDAFDEYFVPFVGDPLDLLVIALDLDIAIRAGLTKRPENLAGYDATELCKIVKGWMPGKVPGNVIIAIPVMSIESWVLAALYPKQAHPEDEQDPAGVLVQRKKLQMGKTGPWKRVAEFRGFADSVAKNLKRVRARCSEADRFVKKVEAARV